MREFIQSLPDLKSMMPSSFFIDEIDRDHIGSTVRELFIGPLWERFTGANDLGVGEPWI